MLGAIIGDLAAALTGAIAEAMYGCQHLLLKRKYCPDGETLRQIEFPSAVSNSNAGLSVFCMGSPGKGDVSIPRTKP